MDNAKQLKEGQSVWLVPTDRNDMYNKEPQEYIIKKVGRRYLEAYKKGQENLYCLKFDIKDNFKHVSSYSPDWQIYFSKQEIIDLQEAYNLAEKIRNTIGNYGIPKLTLEQLRAISKLL